MNPIIQNSLAEEASLHNRFIKEHNSIRERHMQELANSLHTTGHGTISYCRDTAYSMFQSEILSSL